MSKNLAVKSFGKLFFAAVIGVFAATGASFAQSVEQQVAKIRVQFTEVNQRINKGARDKTSGFHYAAWTVGGERDGQLWRAVGSMKIHNEFWFDGEPGMETDGETPDARKTIRKIVTTYAGAADLRTRSEYLFDENTGELVFAFTNELEAEGKTTERRFYFAKGKLIRLAQAGKNTDSKFSAADTELAKNELESAKRLQDQFALIFAE